MGGEIPGHGFVDPNEDGGPVEVEHAEEQLAEDNLLDLPVLDGLDLNLNDEPVAVQNFDLNESADMQEMVIDPVFQEPQQNEMFLELNDLLIR